jgi:hypothetical protein
MENNANAKGINMMRKRQIQDLMTQDEINQMVEQAGFHGVLPIGLVMDVKQLETLIKLAAAKEREACAKLCEGINSLEDYYGERIELTCAEAIRARTGEQA